MSEPVVYDADYSTYVRSVRIVLEEKDVAYRLQPVDIFSGEGQSPEHLARHPFGKIPAFEHAGLVIYETSAIARYIDDAFAGPPLQPADPATRARMDQIIGVIDNYAYDAFVWKVFVERNAETFLQRPTDEAVIIAAMPMARTIMSALETLAGDGTWLCADAVSLADCWLVPVMHYLTTTPEGGELLATSTRLSNWWQAIGERQSVIDTVPSA